MPRALGFSSLSPCLCWIVSIFASSSCIYSLPKRGNYMSITARSGDSTMAISQVRPDTNCPDHLCMASDGRCPDSPDSLELVEIACSQVFVLAREIRYRYHSSPDASSSPVGRNIAASIHSKIAQHNLFLASLKAPCASGWGMLMSCFVSIVLVSLCDC